MEPSPPAELVHARLDHFRGKVVALTGTLTDACEHGITAVRLGDVVDEFHDENGLARRLHRRRGRSCRPWRKGARRSTTLMPVTRISASVDCSIYSGAFWWMARVALVLMGPASSTGSPMTFMMRPSVSTPTGTMIGSPVSLCFLTANETFGRVQWRWCARCLRRGAGQLREPDDGPDCPLQARSRISGSWPSGNLTSTTAPMTCVMVADRTGCCCLEGARLRSSGLGCCGGLRAPPFWRVPSPLALLRPRR